MLRHFFDFLIVNVVLVGENSGMFSIVGGLDFVDMCANYGFLTTATTDEPQGRLNL